MHASDVFRHRHPLAHQQLLYAGVGSHGKPFDNLVYRSLSFALKHIPAARSRWLQGESELLLLKLPLRPNIHKHILHIIKMPSASWEVAANAIEDVHARHLARLSEQSEPPVSIDSVAQEEAIAFLRELVRWDEQQQHDKDYQRQHSLSMAPSIAKLTRIQQCAPECMKRALTSASGLTHSKAKLLVGHRRRLTMFLLKCGSDAKTITGLMLPRVTIEYEMENALETCSSIKASVEAAADLVHNHGTRNAPEGKDTYFVNQTCLSVMAAGMCPFQPPKDYRLRTMEQRREDSKRRYKISKTQCHKQLHEVTQIQVATSSKKRKATGSTTGGTANPLPVLQVWAASPHEFALQKQRLRNLALAHNANTS